MGSGKSTFGMRLAKAIGYEFVDLDLMIEKSEGLSINEIFKLKGENYFRSVEKETLFKITDQSSKIVATGGGTPCFNENLDLMKKSGFIIFVKESIEILFERLKQNKNHRPLVKNLNDQELLGFIENKYSERLKYYREADLTVSSNWVDFKLIKHKFKEFQKNK